MSFISNRKWFKTYVLIRQIILFLLLVSCCLCLFLFQDKNSAFFKMMMGIGGMLMMVILLFDYRERPAFFELEKQQQGLLLQLFLPDYRYLFFLEKSM